MHVTHLVGDRTMNVSFIYADIAKVLDQTKLGRDVTI